MKRRYIYYCLIVSFILTGLSSIAIRENNQLKIKKFRLGQIADKDIIAPYDFPILKTKQQIDEEKAKIEEKQPPIYIISDDIYFDVLKQLDRLILPFAISKQSVSDTTTISSMFRKDGIKLSRQSILLLQNSNNAKMLYEMLHESLNEFYQKGIYEDLSTDSVLVSTNSEVFSKNISNFISTQKVKSELLSKSDIPSNKALLKEILPFVLKPNLIYNDYATQESINSRQASVPQTTGSIKKNEIIIRKNDRIDETILNKIESMKKYKSNSATDPGGLNDFKKNLSQFLYILTLALITVAFCTRFYPKKSADKNFIIAILIGFSLIYIFLIVSSLPIIKYKMLVPYWAVVIFSALLIDIPFAMFFNIIALGLALAFGTSGFEPPAVFLSQISLLLIIYKMHDKHQYFSIWIYSFLTMSLFITLFLLFISSDFIIIINNIGLALMASTINVLLLILLIPFSERKLNLPTRQELLTLLDFNHPLMKKLATEAIGTYYHSLVVGNLAERAAEAIGSDSLLARVGSYYHDIGKIVNPQYFTENNPESAAIHDQIDPAVSAESIKNHVTEGLTLAERYRLPQKVKEIILQHHGTGYIRYFLDKAEKSGQSFDLDDFKYNGPKPSSKEAALVMIADIVESIAKSWNEVSPDELKKILNDTIIRLIKEGQLDEAPLSINELIITKNSMIPILESIYRKRQHYPENKEWDDNR